MDKKLLNIMLVDTKEFEKNAEKLTPVQKKKLQEALKKRLAILAKIG